MSTEVSVVCKPTPWFLFRACVMLAMFSVFAGMFFMDGSTGYRKKNEVFYLHRTFLEASREFQRLNEDGKLTAEEWRAHAAASHVALPEDSSVLPASIELPMPWPEILHDYERMKPLQWNSLWLEYSGERGMPSSPAEHPYDAGKIREQWIVFWICLALALAAAFILLRTLRRSISADASGITTQQGKRVSYGDITRLDLRKWEAKGLAFVDYEGAAGKGRIRIDGLTYGGFKPEQGAPAEKLMQLLRSRFSGEIVEYAPAAPDQSSTAGG